MAPAAHAGCELKAVVWGGGEHVNSVELQPDKRGVEVSNLKVMSVCARSEAAAVAGAGPS